MVATVIIVPTTVSPPHGIDNAIRLGAIVCDSRRVSYLFSGVRVGYDGEYAASAPGYCLRSSKKRE